jgi:hypothetical protein
LLFRENSIYVTEGNFDEKTVFADVRFGMTLATIAVLIQEYGQDLGLFLRLLKKDCWSWPEPA